MNTLFPNNVGIYDRGFRLLLGLALVSLFIYGPQSPLGLIGIVPILTSLVGNCPLYRLFGVNTCDRKEAGAC